MPFRLYFLVLILFILYAAFQDNQLYLFVFVAVCAEFYKSQFFVGEILSRCRCVSSAKCAFYTGQRGKIVLFAFFPGGGDGNKEESYWCSWSWKAWIWACFILNMIVMFWHSLILIKNSLCYFKWSFRVTKQLKKVLKTQLFLVATESEYAKVCTPKWLPGFWAPPFLLCETVKSGMCSGGSLRMEMFFTGKRPNVRTAAFI